MTAAPESRQPGEPVDLPSVASGVDIRERLGRLARNLGFSKIGIAPASRAPNAGAFLKWIEEGFHADMAWLARDPERRCDPRLVLPGTRSIILLATNYYQGEPAPSAGWRIARYAWGGDYHDLLKPRLAGIDAWLRELGGKQLCYTDTGPLLERDHAARAGLGWQGKSTMLLDRRLGKWFFLSAILTTLDLPADSPAHDYCGRCTRCIDACPTRAIVAPHRLDARRCIAYLTIENRGPIPLEFRAAMGDRIFGCDACLDACPWNRFARASQEAAFSMPARIAGLRLADLLALDREGFNKLFKGSPVKRAKYEGFLRNVCVAAGNSGDRQLLPLLENLGRSASALVAEHALWAVERLSLTNSQ